MDGHMTGDCIMMVQKNKRLISKLQKGEDYVRIKKILIHKTDFYKTNLITVSVGWVHCKNKIVK